MEVALPPPAFAPKSASKCNDPPPAELEQGDFLAIDDLLDFSNEDIGGPIEPCVSSATSCELKLDASLPFDRKLSSQPCGFDSDSLCVPCDDLAELEWLSNFVEESFSSSDAPACLGASFGAHSGLTDDDKAAQRRSKNEESFHTTSPVSVLETNAFAREKHCPPFSFSPDMPSVPGRARSKRCRTAVCFWNTRILCPEVSESLLERASTTYTIRAGSSDSNMYNSYYDYDDEEDHAQEEDDDDAGPLVLSQPNQRAKNPSVKFKNSCYVKAKDSIKHFSPKPKKMKVDDGTPIRKCLHCATQKTPQWRAGPMGPKTLCNACGVRFKSGRLCEEYRPAASPTFIEAVHSNSHRKVLEMRRQRGDMVIGHDSQRHKDNSHRLKWSTGGELSSATGAATVEDDEQQASVVSKDNEAARIEE